MSESEPAPAPHEKATPQTVGSVICGDALSIEDRCVGSLLSTMICTFSSTPKRALNESLTENLIRVAFLGDALGAPVEGWTPKEIEFDFPGGIVKYEARPHMGLWHRGPRIAMYAIFRSQNAFNSTDSLFGSTGTNAEPYILLRYTDDTNAALALASSLVECGGLDPKHAAMNYAKFWQHVPERGCPPSASRTMKALLNGTPYTETGTMQYANNQSPNNFAILLNVSLLFFRFPDGSWANGGPMRICAIGLAFRNATDAQLYEAVRQALLATHVHPHSVDASFITCKAISLALKQDPAAEWDLDALLQTLYDCSRSEAMRERIKTVKDHRLDQFESFEDEFAFIRSNLADEFQIVATDAVGLVLWAFVRHNHVLGPAATITKAIGYGGDTDTIACILGGILGSLHGTSWIPWKWYDQLENGEWGRDYCIDIGRGLAKLDLTNHL